MSHPEIYILNCIVVGQHVPFSIKIEKNETVGRLKDLIKQKSGIKFLAKLLTLYHVEIAADEDMLERVKDEMSKNPKALNPLKELGRIFDGDPKEETLHIIVQPPPTSE